MVERWLYFRKRGAGGDELGDELCELLEEGERREGARAPATPARPSRPRCSRASLRWAHGGPAALEAAIDGEMTKRRRELERGHDAARHPRQQRAVRRAPRARSSASSWPSPTSPTARTRSQMDKVMGGIAEALIATGVGPLRRHPGRRRLQRLPEEDRRHRGQRLVDLQAALRLHHRRQGDATGCARRRRRPQMKIAADSVRDLASLDSGNHAVAPRRRRSEPWAPRSGRRAAGAAAGSSAST